MKEVQLFNMKFVHFMWDNSFDKKEGFLADKIGDLQDFVNDRDLDYLQRVRKNTGPDSGEYPFRAAVSGGNTWRFFYHDPNYDIKYAFYKEGKKIQMKVDGYWVNCVEHEPLWNVDYAYRVKPEEENHIVYLNRIGMLYLTDCCESEWEAVQIENGAKTKLFIGTKSECRDWYGSRSKLVEVIRDWEDGMNVQSKRKNSPLAWSDCDEPLWRTDYLYRVNPVQCVDSKESVEKPRRMTYRELSEWLSKGNGQCQISAYGISTIYQFLAYDCKDDDKEIPDNIKIRYWDSNEWVEPTLDLYLKGC